MLPSRPWQKNGATPIISALMILATQMNVRRGALRGVTVEEWLSGPENATFKTQIVKMSKRHGPALRCT